MATVFIDLEDRDRQYRRQLLAKFHELREQQDMTEDEVRDRFVAWAGKMPSETPPALQGMLWIVLALYYLSDAITPAGDPDETEEAADGSDAVEYAATDPLIDAVRKDLDLQVGILAWTASPEDHPDVQLLFESQRDVNGDVGPHAKDEKKLAGVIGILIRERRTDPDHGLRFERALANARAEYAHHEKRAGLYTNVLGHLIEEGDHRDDPRVSAEHWAGVVDALADQRITGDDMYLQMRVRQALKGRAGDSGGGGSGGGTPSHHPGGSNPSWIDIDLPDLEAEVDTEIVADNIRGTQALYFASVLEEAKVFQVMDRILEQFHLGLLPLGKGSAGDKLYKYYKQGFERLTETERRTMYARTFGIPGGEAHQENPNRAFLELWFRFISSVSEYRRQLEVDSLLRAETAVNLNQEQIRQAGRDLAANLSLYGYGVAYFAATELQQQVRDIIAILNDDEIKAIHGARDVYQVIDQVAALELGGARNSVRYRTMANSGAVIMRWLAENAAELGRAGGGRIFSKEDLIGAGPRPDTNPLVNPSNRDLIRACDQYLTVTGTPDARVEEYTQPSVSPEGQTSRPIQIPGVARDLLESAGISGATLN